MKNTLLITSLVFLFTTLGCAQISHKVENTTFILPTNAIKIAKESLAYSRVQQNFVDLPHIYKINEVYIGFTSLKATSKDRATLELVKQNNDYDQANEFKSSDIYTSKIETINNNDVYLQYFFTENLGDYKQNIGDYFVMVYNYKIKKMFMVTVAFENQSNYAEATKILYDFLNTVSFPAYVNTEQSATYQKKFCSYPNGIGSFVVNTVEAGKFTSRISQDDADAQAFEDAILRAPHNAEMFGTCTYSNTAKSGIFTKYCNNGSIGSSVTYTVAAGRYTSTISPSDADTLAQADVTANGQNYANANGTCVFKSTALTNVSFRRNNCISPKVGSYVAYSALAGAFTSTVSQADADAKAQAAGQANANTKGTCN